MDPHHTARLLAVARILVGVALLSGAGVAARALGVDAPARTTRMLVRTTGARDLALGVGALGALADGRDASRWVRLGALADAVDAVAVVAARRDLGAGTVVGGAALAGAAAVFGARAAGQLDG